MVIKNKNGTLYQLRGPNPIMKEQEIWKDFEVHNMTFTEDVITNIDKEVNKSKKKINLGKTYVINNISDIIPVKEKTKDISSIIIIEEEFKPDFNPSVIEEENIEKPKTISSKLLDYKKTIMHCLLANVDTNFDDLYNERTIRVSYGSKFNFEAILIQEEDFQLIFWTHLEKITKHSIFYPKNKEKRWWKATNIKNAPEGFFIQCMPSEFHPNFD